MGVTSLPNTDGETNEQLLGPGGLAKLSDEALQDQFRKVRQKQVDQHARFTVSLATVVAQSRLPISAIAERMGTTEAEVTGLIAQLGPVDDRQIMSFLAACGATDGPVKDEVLALLTAVKAIDLLHMRITRERSRRDRAKWEREKEELERKQAEAAAKATRASIWWTRQSRGAIADAPGHVSKPDPLEARTEEEFVDAMRRYRIWAGNPSLREMAYKCGQKFSHTTFRNMLNAQSVPAKLDVIDAFVNALGGTSEDRSRWATAWRHFTIPPPAPCAQQPLTLRLTETRAG